MEIVVIVLRLGSLLVVIKFEVVDGPSCILGRGCYTIVYKSYARLTRMVTWAGLINIIEL